MSEFQVYMVGGAVRDRLLGRPMHDRDWVVVGATPAQMTGQGFVPVGRDFPVFLHPKTHEEYALARTERKSGIGYHGFTVLASPDVTLEEDLARRDLTINAIAAPADWTGDSAVFDPYNGQRDLQHRVLRHVTLAFREDPVRILRVARFAARFHDFSVAPETLALMHEMVAEGEADALVAERVWQEMARGLMEDKPSRMFEVLRACQALAVLLPEIDALWQSPQAGEHLLHMLDLAAQLDAPLPVRFACLCLQLDPALVSTVCARWRVPNDCRELAELVVRERNAIHASTALDAAGLLSLLERCDALRKPQRFEQALAVCECDARSHTQPQPAPYAQRERLSGILQTALAVATAPIAQDAARRGLQGRAVGEAIAQAREQAIAACLSGRG
ncbi:multifunctional CCA addition/repair protein [Comamonas composti]|uniref:multifunctional CCA addition/repair protein n=1 Tax=Comamonas composti TaxID=408558 RepID=UPI00047B2493|nr:multifunctional CCA addition/repair protein [Comamonas composti]